MARFEVVQGGSGGCSSGGCGGTQDQMTHLPAHIRAKIENHPCYSEKAHHHFARMHVAVAPACNIQCNYCNRKYDCSNESRPGVVSELLTPEQAVKKCLAVGAAIPQMTVVGIAGPGDPLANPERTFATFRELSAKAPDIKLCVSTNGLTLPDHVDELTKHNIEHVTITINCIDPEVGQNIYPWIFHNHRRIRGRKAAEILIERQLTGLSMLTERGVLVKVNSVMIPGINDRHLKEVNREVKARGAFLHNIMPLIAEAEHGTYFGLRGQRGPTNEELKALQDECAGDMNMMRHCRQCRADAVGMLGEDRGAEFSLDKIDQLEVDYSAAMARRAEVHAAIAEKMNAPAVTEMPVTFLIRPEQNAERPALIAVTTSGGGVINQHFGHAREFLVYEADAYDVRFVGTRRADAYCTGADHCDEGEDKLARVLKALEGCDAVLSARIGLPPFEALENAGILPSSEFAMEPIESAVAAIYRELAAKGLLKNNRPQKAAG